MKGVEASTISRSQSESFGGTARRSLIMGEYSKIDFMFPLFDQMLQRREFPKFFHIIFTFYFYFQMCVTSLWTPNAFWDNSRGVDAQAQKWIKLIAWWFTRDIQWTVPASVLLVMMVLVMGWFAIELIVYKRNRRFALWSLIPMKFLLEFIALDCVQPAAALFGGALRRIAIGETGVAWAFLVIGAIGYFGFLGMACLYVVFKGHSCYLSSMPLFTHCPAVVVEWLLISTIAVFLGNILAIFDDWAMLIAQVLHFVVLGAFSYQLLFLPFQSLGANVVASSVVTACLFMDIIMVIFFFVKVPQSLAVIIMVLVFIISCIVYSIVYRKKINRVVQDLTYDPEEQEQMNEQDFQELLTEKKVLNSKFNMLLYLHVGLMKICPLFVNSMLNKVIAASGPPKEVMFRIVQYLVFFPGESRQLNMFFANATTRRDLTMGERFLVYQAYRVKTLRQSSVSSDANGRLSDLKLVTQQCYDDVLSFWVTKNASLSYFEMLSSECSRVKALWQEAIRDFPNNAKFSEEYCSFLIECMADLNQSLVQKQRSELIESGRNFAVDLSFRSLVRCYPEYIKKKVLDTHGNLIRRAGKRKGSASSGGVSQSQDSSSKGMSSTSGSIMEIDAEMEETLGRQLFRNANVRLGLHKALSARKSKISVWLIVFGVIALIAGVVCFAVLFVIFDDVAKSRGESLNYVDLAIKTQFHIELATMDSFLKYAWKTGRFPVLNSYTNLEKNNCSDTSYINIGEDMWFTIRKHAMGSENYFTQLLGLLADMANNGDDVYSLAAVMVKSQLPFYVCHNGSSTSMMYVSLKSINAYVYLGISNAAKADVTEDWYLEDPMCELLVNADGSRNGVLSLMESLVLYLSGLANQESSRMKWLQIFIPIGLFVVDFLPLCILIQLFTRDANKLAKLLLSLDNNIKEEAKNPIRKDMDFEKCQIAERKASTKTWPLMTLLVFIISLATALIGFTDVKLASDTNQMLLHLVYWQRFSAYRYFLVPEVIHSQLEMMVTVKNVDIKVKNWTTFQTTAATLMSWTTLTNDYLLKGDGSIPPCTGADAELDKINMQQVCEVGRDETELHDTYKCSSATQGLSVLKDMYNLISNRMKDEEAKTGKLDHEVVPHMLHLANRHLFKRFEEALTRMSEMCQEECDQLTTDAFVCLMVGIALSIVMLILAGVLYSYSVTLYRVGLALIQRVPPLAFSSNKKLLDFVMNKKGTTQTSEMSISQNAIHTSADGIICTGLTGVIEIVNPAVSDILGYTPDQLLGQSSSILFSEAEAERISNQIELMANGQSAAVYEDHTICVTDSSAEIHCSITILAMSSSSGIGSSGIESFVIIIRDETELVLQQTEAEKAKAQSEFLLYQILPRDIVLKINQGEKDISFTVPSASITFIDIVRFSDYAAGLSPQEIMGNLSLVFAAFDQSAKNYPLLLKIKLIGDVYMAAAGLFGGEDMQPKDHATQTVKFGLECLSELDDVNVKLNANLQVRIGVNSGGPLLAGVLGTDKPVFDIIGDPINVASRLQSTDVPGKIQIPQSTYELIQGADFNVEQRGEIYLKGKGKTMAYLVSPQSMLLTGDLGSDIFSRDAIRSSQNLELT